MSNPPRGGGIGEGRWGASYWGGGEPVDAAPAVITPLSPLSNEVDVAASSTIAIRITDDYGIWPASIHVTIGPTVYVMGGVAQNGAVLTTVANDGNGLDLSIILPAPLPFGSRQEVVISVRNQDDLTTTYTYFFSVGAGLRLLQVRNPAPNILIAYYNRSLRQDAALRSVPNWGITPISVGAAPLEITEVLTNTNHPDVVTLRYEGGGSTYLMTSAFVYDSDDNQIDPNHNSALFEILFGDEPDPTIRMFDTIYGPIGMVHRIRLRRTMDDHVIGRSMALGVDEQFRLRLGNLDGSAGRDGRPGKNRT